MEVRRSWGKMGFFLVASLSKSGGFWFCLGWVLHPKLWRWQRRSRAIVRGLGSRGGRPRGEAGDEVMGGRLWSAVAGKLGLHTDL